MAAPNCKILVFPDAPRAILRIIGRATASAAPDFLALLQRLKSQGYECLVFELSECVLMDSTVVGHLAQLALRQAEVHPSGKANILLVNPGEHITTLLDTIFVLDLFEVVHGQNLAQPDSAAEETQCQSRSREEVNRCCLEAHKALAALAPENAAKFQDVIRFLEAESK